MQVWKIDINNFYTGDSYFVVEPSENEVTIPILVGYVKPKWTGVDWVEGATEQEIQEWKDSNIIEREPTEMEVLQAGLANTNLMILELTELMLGGM
jgi:hypothetical protein